MNKLDDGFEHQFGIIFRELCLKLEQLLTVDINHGTANQCDGAHQQREVKAVPDRQAVFRHSTLQCGTGSGVQQIADNQGWHNADQQTQGYQNLNRYPHITGWLVRCFRQIDRFSVEKHIVNKAQRVGHREHGA